MEKCPKCEKYFLKIASVEMFDAIGNKQKVTYRCGKCGHEISKSYDPSTKVTMVSEPIEDTPRPNGEETIKELADSVVIGKSMEEFYTSLSIAERKMELLMDQKAKDNLKWIVPLIMCSVIVGIALGFLGI